ncbi:MAG: acyl-CoA thioesterase [Elusimicrobia bacterium]|nr:acyl-CoA thioesterase [Elusimicrobiota bacterium]
MQKPLPGRPPKISKTTLANLMLPEDANPRGKVFGGSVLKLIDNAAYVAACRHAGTANCVTVSMDKVDFKVPIEIGELVILESQVHYTGRTSIQVGVNVFAENLNSGRRRLTNSCLVTFVAVDAQGRPAPVPAVKPQTAQEKKLYHEAHQRRLQQNQ